MGDRRQSGLWAANPNTGYFEQQPQAGPYQYYQPPSRSSKDQRRSFSDRAGQPATNRSNDNGEPQRTQSQRVRDLAQGASRKVHDDDAPGVEESGRTRQAGRRRGQSDAPPPALPVDSDDTPSNLRSKPWSPEPDMISPGSGRPQQAANASERLRKGSVSDRSPLQKLEMEFAASKDEKRAKTQEAEYRAQLRRAQRQQQQGDVLRQGSMRTKGGDRSVSDGARPGMETHVGGGTERFRRASDALKHENQPREGKRFDEPTLMSRYDQPSEANTGLERTQSGKYRHRARDAGFAGAAAAYGGTGPPPVRRNSAAERGKAAYERRKAQDGGVVRSGSNKLQKRPPPATEWYSQQSEHKFRGPQDQPSPRGEQDMYSSDQRQPTYYQEPHVGKQALQSDRLGAGSKKEKAAAMAHQDPDPLPPERVANSPHNPLNYKIPPQTAGGQEARQAVGFAEVPAPGASEKHHRFGGGLWHRHEHRSYQPSAPALDEWRNAAVVKLSVDDLEFETAKATSAGAQQPQEDKNAAWWEKGGQSRRSSSTGSRTAAQQPPQYDGPYEEQASSFRPALFLKCGPLLRYTGMRKEAATTSRSARAGQDKEIWQGSIMIVTDDAGSDLSAPPTLRLFAQPMDLHFPPPQHMLDSGHELPPEYEDPVAGQVKLSRTGRPLYVRPVHDLEGGVDLSREENNDGLYSATRPSMMGPQSSTSADNGQIKHIQFQDKSRVKKHSGETAKRYKEVRGTRLHTERGTTFWRFNIEIELGSHQHRVAYRINRGPALGFWVPARGETMNMLFHSCNGFSASVNPDDFSGPDPLWRDVLNRHQSRPFHVMLGGGDQIYNDAVMRNTVLFKEWLATKNPEAKHRADFTRELQEELEEFYLERYAMWFSQGLFGMAGSQIPMVNIWDDHDIIDGYGSYPHHFMSSRVFTGLGAVAFKYYMLFQHHSVVAETEKDEPSWLLGASPGPYINELSRHVFMHLGRKVAFVGLDCRTERMRDEVLSQESYEIIFERLRKEIIEGETKHLIVLLGVPIAYPRLNFLENVLTSNVMVPIKALGRTGMLGGFINKFDGGVEILDDLDDHWTAKHHKAERNWLIQELQELAAEKSVRITILGGDVHLGAVGQFYTPKKYGVRKDKDHRYMPNVVSSAIVNTPPPSTMADVLNKRNKVHHLDDATDEDMIPLFENDVDGAKRNNRCLLPRRNYCVIGEYVPGSTPPSSPKHDMRSPQQGMDGAHDGQEADGGRDRRYPPGSMKRSMSMTRAGGLIRRLSGSGRSKNPPMSYNGQNDYGRQGSQQSYGEAASSMQRSNSMGGPHPESSGSYFPPQQGDDDFRPSFHRRPTNLSTKEARKAAARGGPTDEGGAMDGAVDPVAINLEGGLDISLNMEVDQKDPGGTTAPYRLLVPALWYDGEADDNVAEFKGHREGLLERFKGRGRKSRGEEEEEEERSRTPSPPPPTARRQKPAPQHLRSPEDDIRGPGQGAGAANQKSRASYDGAESGRYLQQNDYEQPSSGNRSAYDKGYNISSPPLGSRAPGRVGAAKSPYPDQHAAQRHASAPTSSSRPAAGAPYGREDEYTEGSLTPSEEYDDASPRPGPPARRPSKAERFFGIGDDRGPWGGGGGGSGGRRPSTQQQDVGFEEPPKRRPSWKIWK